jgi:hypothetical protein
MISLSSQRCLASCGTSGGQRDVRRPSHALRSACPRGGRGCGFRDGYRWPLGLEMVRSGAHAGPPAALSIAARALVSTRARWQDLCQREPSPCLFATLEVTPSAPKRTPDSLTGLRRPSANRDAAPFRRPTSHCALIWSARGGMMPTGRWLVLTPLILRRPSFKSVRLLLSGIFTERHACALCEAGTAGGALGRLWP